MFERPLDPSAEEIAAWLADLEDHQPDTRGRCGSEECKRDRSRPRRGHCEVRAYAITCLANAGAWDYATGKPRAPLEAA